jgi:MoxR-like ATPase
MLQYVPSTVEHIQAELRKVIVGQDAVVEHVLVALLAEGHALVEGVPGTAKTLLVKTLARIVGADFSRIQFTPDLMPSDITGTNVFNTATASFSLRRGPVFTDVLLADEINRTPPKTQAALLEAADEEARIVGNWDAGFNARRLEQVDIRPLSEPDAVTRCRAEVRRAHMEPGVQRYLVEITRRTREHPSVSYGASPRASVALLLCAKALAAMRGRDFTTPDDVRDIARPVLRHRISLRAEAELEGATTDGVITDILSNVEVPR